MPQPEETGFDACRQILATFFERYPNPRWQSDAARVLEALEEIMPKLSGKPAGWAAGIVYCISSRLCGVPGILNHELEQVFGVSMDTVRTRAAHVRQAVPWAWMMSPAVPEG